jgi:TrmH family RNA methyltransferase
MLITSRANTQIKQIRHLLHRKEREDTGLFLAEGFHLVREAFATGAAVETLIVAPKLLDREQTAFVHSQAATRTLEVTPEVFSSISPTDGHQGLAAVVQQRWHPLSEVRLGEELAWVVLDRIDHPGSLGTILRTSEGVGGGGAMLVGDTSDPYSPVAVRASLGAIFSQQLARTTFEEFAAWKQANSASVVGTSPAAEADYQSVDYRPPVVLFMGSRLGLTGEEQAICDMMVRVPMVGRVDSHHIAVAAALVLYEIFNRQRTR